MKKLVLATAVATLYATSAQAAPTVYGKVGLNYEYNDAAEVITQGDGYSSRIGVKGSMAGEHGVKATAQIEMGVDDSAGGTGGLTNRLSNISFGSDQMGTVTLGKQSNFVTGVAGAYDLFSFTSFGDTATAGGWRIGNAMSYTTPKSIPVSFSFGTQVTQVKGGDNIYLAAATYSSDTISAGVGTQQHEDSMTADLYNFNAGYAAYGATLGWGLQYSAETAAKKDDSSVYYGSIHYAVAGTPFALKTQLVYDDSRKNDEIGFAAGAEYAVYKGATAEVYMGSESDVMAFGTGFNYNF